MAMKRIAGILLRTLLVGICSAAGPVWALVIGANYGGAWTLEQKNAFFFSETTLAGYLPTSYQGETIVVDVSWKAMQNDDGSIDTNTLGESQANFYFKNFGSTLSPYREDTWYTEALANHLHGHDLDPGAEMTIVFNSNFTDWYFGTDGNTGGLVDFVWVAMHELTHGLGFITVTNADGSFGLDAPSIWEWYMTGDNGHGETQSFAEMDQAERAAAIAAGGGITWEGEGGVAGNGGAPVNIYSPSSFRAGSSLSHLEPADFSTALMRPSYYTAPNVGAATHALSAVELGMLRDIGWVPEPPTAPMLMVALSLLWVASLRLRPAAGRR